IFVALATSEKSSRLKLIELGLAAAAAFVLIMAHSATALAGLGLFLLVLLALRVPRLTAYVFGAILAARLLTMVGMFGGFCILSLIGRDCTFTNRTEIWGLVWSAIMERPWTGYGFGAFWVGESDFGNAIRAKLGWAETITEAHNAWLEAWLSIGI